MVDNCKNGPNKALFRAPDFVFAYFLFSLLFCCYLLQIFDPRYLNPLQNFTFPCVMFI